MRNVEAADAVSVPITSNLMLDFSSSILMVCFAKMSPPLHAVSDNVLRASRVEVVLIIERVHVEGATFEGLTQECLRERPKKEQKETKDRILIGVFTSS